MAINVQHIKDVETASSVSNDSKLLLTPDNGQYTRATISNIVGSTVDSNEFIVNSTTKKIELKNKTFVGTTAEWEALTTAQKSKYTIVNITDDSEGGGGGTIIGDAYDVEYQETTVGDMLDNIDSDLTDVQNHLDAVDGELDSIGDILDMLLEDITFTINVSTSETTLYGADVTISYNGKSETKAFSAQGDVQFKLIKYTGEVTITSTDGEDTATGSVTIVDGIHSYSASLAFSKIYGVTWAGTESSVMTRTDGAAGFNDPSPAVNNGTGSSPFDTISPWKDIKVVDDATGGKLVEIPKYYYKWTKTGTSMSLQISETEEDGFNVSPAHADRGDGKGERDVVYVGRYHCASSTYKSTTGVAPQVSQTRSTFRTSIHNLGSTYWQYDFAMYWTIMMLYIVEYANWNSQATIGYGCSDSGSIQNSGLTDSMQYHTGTNAANRTTYGHVQYRYIEDLWGNCYDWCDGIYFNAANIYCIKNPSSFSDSSNGTLVGTRPTSSGWISAWNVPSTNGFEYALYPSEVGGGEATYISDYCYYDSSGVVLRVGGNYNQGQNLGAFYLNGSSSASSSDGYIGGRLMKLP